jgi:hypothetical protein
MASSYDKISKHLLHCQDSRDTFRRLEEGLRSPKFVSYEFRLVKEHGKPVRAVPIFKVDVGIGTISRRIDSETIEVGRLDTWELGNIFPTTKIVDDNFGTKHCPTYNCSKDRVAHGGDNGIGFEEAVRDEIGRQFGNRRDENGTVVPGLLVEASVSVRQLLVDASSTPEFREAKFEFLRKHAIEDIIEVMSLYDCLGKEVLREALDQFVMHQIMEED